MKSTIGYMTVGSGTAWIAWTAPFWHGVSETIRMTGALCAALVAIGSFIMFVPKFYEFCRGLFRKRE